MQFGSVFPFCFSLKYMSKLSFLNLIIIEDSGLKYQLRIHQSTWWHIPQDLNLHQQHCENLKFHSWVLFL
jgi:hypothetical protein